MTEVISWNEGNVYLYTGAAGGTSALLAYASDMRAAFGRGWSNFQTYDDVYHDVQTGRRADVVIGTLYTLQNSALHLFEASATAIHMHLKHSGVYGTAGFWLYSGRLDYVELIGRSGDLMQYRLTYHANEWSAY